MLLLIPVVFLSGILTVFSPCALPILPIVLTSGIDGKIGRIRGTIAGLVVSFTLTSLFLAVLVRAFGIPADMIRTGAVILLIILGLSMVFPIIWERVQIFIEKHWKLSFAQGRGDALHAGRQGFGGGFLTGVSLGIVWTPCIGPVAAAAATLAAANSLSIETIFIAFAYAAGTGLPLYFIAKGGRSFTARLGVFKQNNQKIRQVFGIIIFATAMFIWIGTDRGLQAWTLTHLPESWTQLSPSFEKRLNVDRILQQLKGK